MMISESVDIRQSSLNNKKLEKGVVDTLAAKSASVLFSQLNGSAVRTALSPLFAYMDNKKKWWPPNFSVSIMELVLDALQPQNRYLLVSEVLQQLELLTKDNKTDVSDEKLASLVSILDTILNANIPLVGISVLEVLNSLFNHLISALQGRSFRNEQPSESEGTSAMYEYAIHQGLAHSIGGLASQTYYQNQLNDVTGYIIAKLRAGTTLNQVDGLQIHEYRRVALICLELIVTTSKEAGDDDEYASEGNIALSSWLPAISLLTDRVPGKSLFLFY